MFAAKCIPYQLTGSFSKIVLDYLDHSASLASFYQTEPNLAGVKEAIKNKLQQTIDRETLVETLQLQYASLEPVQAVIDNIKLLSQSNTFTICTAHQPNLFTGPLYFIYKILHAIKLSNKLKEELPDFEFVPVFYMGSEDADLAELNHFYLEGKKYEWATSQTGAVGRMLVDKALIELLKEVEGQLSIHPFGNEWLALVRKHFTLNSTIQDATLHLVNDLFAKFGLVVLIADHPGLKRTMQNVFEDDLFNHIPSSIVTKTGVRLQETYTEQAHARDINLFYLKDAIRERIERSGDEFIVCNTTIRFSKEDIKTELFNHPEHFSPNVILRGLFQESILPNIAFIGGGGEVAYWLQLKDLFHHYRVPYPLLILRNSFLIIEKKWQTVISKLGLDVNSTFQPTEQLFNSIVLKSTDKKISISSNLENLQSIYEGIAEQVQTIDVSLLKHVKALKMQALNKLQEVEKKMLRAEKRKFAEQLKQIEAFKKQLFPRNGLQERVDNLGYYYAKWGTDFIDELYNHSLDLEQEFTILTIMD